MWLFVHTIKSTRNGRADVGGHRLGGKAMLSYCHGEGLTSLHVREQIEYVLRTNWNPFNHGSNFTERKRVPWYSFCHQLQLPIAVNFVHGAFTLYSCSLSSEKARAPHRARVYAYVFQGCNHCKVIAHALLVHIGTKRTNSNKKASKLEKGPRSEPALSYRDRRSTGVMKKSL